MSYSVHICIFTGTRTGQHPPPGTKCELTAGPRWCKRAAEYASYAWGGAALCAKHLDEECGEAATNAAGPDGASGTPIARR